MSLHVFKPPPKAPAKESTSTSSSSALSASGVGSTQFVPSSSSSVAPASATRAPTSSFSSASSSTSSSSSSSAPSSTFSPLFSSANVFSHKGASFQACGGKTSVAATSERGGGPVTVHVEICLVDASPASAKDVEAHVRDFLEMHCVFLREGLADCSSDKILSSHVRSMYIYLPSEGGEENKHKKLKRQSPVQHGSSMSTSRSASSSSSASTSSSSSSSTTPATASTPSSSGEKGIPFWHARLVYYVYKLSSEVGQEDLGDGGSGADAEENVACHQWMLPATDFEGLWQSLHFESGVKDNLLSYISTAMLFSDRRVNPTLISCNRVVLLHGPPGTGKTTLCKGLAQKLSIRLQKRFPVAQLIEINAHSLFSKWFSESGKLIQKMFERIQELVDDDQALVCLLIDEVESLAAARQSALAGSEPSDAIRSVNALLTQLDKLKRHNNVLIFTTSNITEAIDLAFIDRADIKQYIGNPNLHARYEILRSCIDELVRVGIIAVERPAVSSSSSSSTSSSLSSLSSSVGRSATAAGATTTTAITSPPYPADLLPFGEALKLYTSRASCPSAWLLQVCCECKGSSGRFLRKLPFQAHAFFLSMSSSPVGVSVMEYLHAMWLAVLKERKARAKMTQKAPRAGLKLNGAEADQRNSGSGGGKEQKCEHGMVNRSNVLGASMQLVEPMLASMNMKSIATGEDENDSMFHSVVNDADGDNDDDDSDGFDGGNVDNDDEEVDNFDESQFGYGEDNDDDEDEVDAQMRASAR